MPRKTRKRDSHVAKSLKQESQRLADLVNAESGLKLTRSQALETTARIHGFLDWNTACKSSNIPSLPFQQVQDRCLQELDRVVQNSDREVTADERPQLVEYISQQLIQEVIYSQWTRELRNEFKARKEPVTSDHIPRNIIEVYIDKYRKEKGEEPAPGLTLEELSLGKVSAQGRVKYQKRRVKWMRRAGMPEYLIYAYQKTGVAMTEETMNEMDPADVKRHSDAIREYFENRGESYDDFLEQHESVSKQVCDDAEQAIYLTIGWNNPSRHDYSHFWPMFEDKIKKISVDAEDLKKESADEENPWRNEPVFQHSCSFDPKKVSIEDDLFLFHKDVPFPFGQLYKKECGAVLLTSPIKSNGYLHLSFGARLVGDRLVAGVMAISATEKLMHNRAAWMTVEGFIDNLRKPIPVADRLRHQDFNQPFDPNAPWALFFAKVLANRAEIASGPVADDGTFTIYFPLVFLPKELPAAAISQEALGQWYFDIIETFEEECDDHAQAACYLPYIEDSVFEEVLEHSLDYYKAIPAAVGSRRYMDNIRAVELLSCEAPMMQIFCRMSPDQRDVARSLPRPQTKEIPEAVAAAYDKLKYLVDDEIKNCNAFLGALWGFYTNPKGEDTLLAYPERGDKLTQNAPYAIRKMLKKAPVVALVTEVWQSQDPTKRPSEDPNAIDAIGVTIYTNDGRTFQSGSPISGKPRKVEWEEIDEPLGFGGRLALQQSGVAPVSGTRLRDTNASNLLRFSRRLQ